MKTRYAFVSALVLISSILPDLTFPSPYMQFVKLAVLLAMAVLCLLVGRLKPLWKLAASLLTVNASFVLTAAIRNVPGWTALFSGAGFFQTIAGNVAVKLIGILPVAAVLFFLMGSWQKAFLTPGKLSEKADAIGWLGIPGGSIPWGRLSVISGLLIMTGTALLSILTATGFHLPGGGGRLLQYFPLILLLALVNSFCEGLVFRCAVLAPLKEGSPKMFALLMPALFFGIAHYEGIPGGPLGAAMSGILGWYMTRAMYETGGFLSGWIIHFLQDIAVFSTLALLSQ